MGLGAGWVGGQGQGLQLKFGGELSAGTTEHVRRGGVELGCSGHFGQRGGECSELWIYYYAAKSLVVTTPSS